MDKIIAITTVTLGLLLFVFHGNTGAENMSDQVSAHIRQRLEMAEMSSRDVREENPLFRSTLLPEFYREREYRSAWSSGSELSPQIEPFLNILQRAGCEGLRPEDYRLDRIQAKMKELRGDPSRQEPADRATLADLDIFLTDAFLVYVYHLVNGRIDHHIIYPGWVIYRDSPDLTAILQDALDSGSIEEFLMDLLPPYPGYAGLKEEYIRYQDIAKRGGWPVIPTGPKMEKGTRDWRVATLRQRLIASGDLSLTEESDSSMFDHALEAAVRNFQKRHGLKADGRIGRSTLAVLNIPAETRIRQIALNMDRLRWLPGDMGRRYIFVNIADFSLQVIEDEQVVMSMKIIVGKTEQRSCVLSRKMTYLELNPFWRIPDSIATKEILPQVKKKPEYLTKNNIKVFWDWGDRSNEIDPRSVDWSRVRAGNFRYKFRQDPGVLNPLGRIKFMFPNACEIYLHDTPSRHLFGRTRRDFSHGCIRIEKPIDLAAYLLQNKDSWTRKKILAEIRKEKRQVIMLPDPIDVHIFYGTAWIDQEGNLQFRDDIYRIDEISYEVAACRNDIDAGLK
jgi:murein L,D-transpeptidase YcbB/YkuD